MCGQSKSTKKHSTLYEKHMVAMDFCSFYTPLLSKDFVGFNFDFKYYWHKRFSTGLNWSIATKNTTDKYSYTISQPILYYNEVGWINEFEFLQKDKIRANVSLNNGLASTYLGDNAIKLTARGNRHAGFQYASKVAANNYYMIEPGLSISFRLGKEIYITLKSKYRFVNGQTNFGSTNQFSNFYIGLGLSLISQTD